MGLFTSVDVGVLLHVGLLMESLATVLARVGPRVRMNEEVRGQRGAPLERFSALFTAKGFFAVVYGPVLAQADLVAKGFVAQLASVRPLAVMRSSSMDLEAVWCGKYLFALHARVDVSKWQRSKLIVGKGG